MEGIDAGGISSDGRCFEDLGLCVAKWTLRFEPLLLSKLCKAFFFNKHQTVFRTKADVVNDSTLQVKQVVTKRSKDDAFALFAPGELMKFACR